MFHKSCQFLKSYDISSSTELQQNTITVPVTTENKYGFKKNMNFEEYLIKMYEYENDMNGNCSITIYIYFKYTSIKKQTVLYSGNNLKGKHSPKKLFKKSIFTFFEPLKRLIIVSSKQLFVPPNI